MKIQWLRISAFVLVTLGALFLFGTGTIYAVACTTNGTGGGDWTAGATWSGCSGGGGVPASADTITIKDGDTVTVNTSPIVAGVTVGEGTSGFLNIGNNTTARTLTVNGNITIQTGGTFQVLATVNANNILALSGNLQNNGTFNGQPDADSEIRVLFNNTSGDQTVSGSGTTTFSMVTLSKLSTANKVIASQSVTMGSGTTDFDPNDGTWEQTAGTLTKSAGAIDVGSNGALAFTGSGGLTLQDNSLNVNGTFVANTSGTIAIGNGNDGLAIATGAAATLTSGTLNLNGAFAMNDGTTTIDGATINIDPQGAENLVGSNNAFNAAGAANLTFSSGTVTIINPNANTGGGNAVQVVAGAGTKNFAGSTIQLGNGVSTTAGSTDGFDMNCGTTITLGNLIVNNPSGTNRFVRLVSNDCEIGSDMTITAGQFNMVAGAFDLSVAGNFSNSGALAPGSRTVTFNGTGAQTIGGTTATTFSGLTINNVGGSVTLGNNASATGALTLTSDLNTGTNTLTTTGGTCSGTGDVVGNTTRTDLVVGTPRCFGNTNVQITVNAGATAPTAMTVDLQKHVPNDFANAVIRQYTLTPTGGNCAAGSNCTVRLRYLDSELNGNTETACPPVGANLLSLWRFGASWGVVGVTACDSTANWVQQAGVTSFSRWAISNATSSPTSAILTAFSAKAKSSTRVKVKWETGSTMGVIGFNVQRATKRTGAYKTLKSVTADPTDPIGHAYKFVDKTVKSGKAYFYRIEILKADNTTELSDVIKVKVP